MANGYDVVQSELERSARNILSKRQRGHVPVLTVAVDPTKSAFSGQLEYGVGVMRGGRWSNESATIGHLAEFFDSIGDFIRWCLNVTRNKHGQSLVGIDEASLKNLE